MNELPEWLKPLNNQRKGLWSLIWPAGSSFQAQSLVDSSPRDIETAVISAMITEAGSLSLCYKEQVVTGADMQILLASCKQEAIESNRYSVRVFVCGFHKITSTDQCGLERNARAIAHSDTEVSWQFIFCGNWSFLAFREAYKHIHGKTNSPTAQLRDVVRVPPWTPQDVLVLLERKGVIGRNHSEIDRIAADFLVEQTAGDEFLIGEAAQHLEQLGGNWIVQIEKVVDELNESPVVIEAVEARLRSLDANTRAELDRLMRVQRLIRDSESIEVEKLWVAGLALCRDLGSGKQCVSLAGPLIGTVLRRILHNQNPGCVALPEDLCFDQEAVATAAYRRVSQIENMLRNLVVECWHSEDGEKWQERLNKIKIPSHDLVKDDDRRQFLKLLMEYGFLPQKTLGEEADTSQPRPDRPKEPLLTSATHWQQRQSNNHAVELSSSNLMQFLMTESLMSVLVDGKFGLCGQGKPFDKEYLVTALKEYIPIRSAVAHNQAHKLSTIYRLDELHRKFVVWLTNYADHSMKTPPSVVQG